jgi:hypothetical protein
MDNDEFNSSYNYWNYQKFEHMETVIMPSNSSMKFAIIKLLFGIDPDTIIHVVNIGKF